MSAIDHYFLMTWLIVFRMPTSRAMEALQSPGEVSGAGACHLHDPLHSGGCANALRLRAWGRTLRLCAGYWGLHPRTCEWVLHSWKSQ